MSETWAIEGMGVRVDGIQGRDSCRERLEAGVCETWFTSSTGRSLAVVTNGERAMVMLLRWPEDDGVHVPDTRVGETA